MSDLEILINGVDFRPYTHIDSIDVREARQANGQTMRFVLSFTPDEIGAVTLPVGREVIKFLFNGELEFAGRVNTVTDEPRANGYRSIVVECVDWTADFDQILITANYDAQLAGDMVRAIVGTVGRGFTSTNVVDGASIEAIEARYELPSALIGRIVEAIQHQWYIDRNRDMHMFFVDDEPAPIESIDLDTDTDNYGAFDFTRDYSQVKNRIYITGAKSKSSGQHTDVKRGDGSDTRFMPLGYEPWSAEDTTITRDGVPLNILVDSVDGSAGDGQGGPNDGYLCTDNWGVRLPDNYPLGDGEELAVTYNGAYEAVVMVEDAESIALLASLENQPDAPSDGVHELRYEVPDLRVETEEALIEFGNLLLLRYAQPRIDATFISWTQGWRAGQSLLISSTDRELDSTRFYVHSVQKRVLVDNDAPLGGHRLKYQISCSTSPFEA